MLIDLHAVPGGANTEDHGGVSTHVAEMWGSEGYRRLAKECLMYIAEEVKKDNIRGCAGIELCNEACWGAEGMYEWYEDVIRAIGAVDASIPLYISDGWDLGRAVEWCAGMNSTSGGGNPVVVDTHKYYAFTEQDRAQGPGEIIERVRGEMDGVQTVTGNVLENGAVGVVIGEWSCAMDGNTWVKAGEGVDRDGMVRQFGKTQCEQWRKKAGGSFFWTAKMQWMDGGEWGLFEMVKKGAVVAPAFMTMSFADVKLAAERARRQRLDRKQRAVDAHVTYWDSTALGGKFEHWRFEQGWDLGFADALAFFEMRTNDGFQGAKTGADSTGCLELWILKRARETGQMGGFTWEWEHGFRQGVSGFADSVLVLE